MCLFYLFGGTVLVPDTDHRLNAPITTGRWSVMIILVDAAIVVKSMQPVITNPKVSNYCKPSYRHISSISISIADMSQTIFANHFFCHILDWQIASPFLLPTTPRSLKCSIPRSVPAPGWPWDSPVLDFASRCQGRCYDAHRDDGKSLVIW